MLLLGIPKIFRGWKYQLAPMPRYPGTIHRDPVKRWARNGSPSSAPTAPPLPFPFIPCLAGCTVGGNKNRLSFRIQAAASGLFALLFAGKSLNSPPKEASSPGPPHGRGFRAVVKGLSAAGLEPLGCLLHKPPLTVASSEQKPPWPDLNP